MDRKPRRSPTILNKYDRKILEKYIGSYTNMIESNTASTAVNQDQRYAAKT